MTLVGVDPDGMVHLMHFMLSVWVVIYSNSQHLFACLEELPVEAPPPVVEIPHKAFAERHSVRDVPQVDHVTHLGGIPPPNWQTYPCERAGKT